MFLRELFQNKTLPPEFYKWFGNSKVVNADGSPMIVYHGTSKDMDFKHFNIPRNGAWFTVDPEDASAYAENNDSQGHAWDSETGRIVPKHTASRVIPVYLKLTNPKYSYGYPEELTKAVNYKKAAATYFDQLRREGYDSLIIKFGEKPSLFVVLSDPSKIKSAISNKNYMLHKKNIHETYSKEHGYLYHYLNDMEFDPYDYYGYIAEWLYNRFGSVEDMNEELGTNLPDINFDELDAEDIDKFWQAIPDDEKEDCEGWCKDRLMNEDPAEAPSYLHMSAEKRIPRNTWLIHFSDDAWEIKHSGFKYGTDDYTKLGLTTYFKTKVGMKSGEGWNFAFEALSRYASSAAKKGKYGKNAVMFMSSGVEVYHYGDEESQVIFQGNLIKPQDMILLMKNEGDWQVISKDDRVIVTGEFNKIVKWVIDHYQQYRRVL